MTSLTLVSIQKNELNKGNERQVFLAYDLQNSRYFVAKQYIENEPFIKYQDQIWSQTSSCYYASLFNSKTQSLIRYLPSYLIELNDGRVFSVEPLMCGDWLKCTNNSGQLAPAKSELAQAFSHFTYEKSKGQLMVCDIQGWSENKDVAPTIFTDPIIITLKKEIGDRTNCGVEGMKEFFIRHKCTQVCQGLCLPGCKETWEKLNINKPEEASVYQKRVYIHSFSEVRSSIIVNSDN